MVEENCDQRVLKARHDHRFVYELIFVAAHPLQAHAQPTLLLIGHPVDDQHLEIGFSEGAGFEREIVVDLIGLAVVAAERDRSAAIGTGGQRTRDPADGEFEVLDVAMLEQPAEVIEGGWTRKRPVGLDRCKRVEKLLGLRDETFAGAPFGAFRDQRLGDFALCGPAVGAQLRRAVVIADRVF
jgi:hypothetical protein